MGGLPVITVLHALAKVEWTDPSIPDTSSLFYAFYTIAAPRFFLKTPDNFLYISR